MRIIRCALLVVLLVVGLARPAEAAPSVYVALGDSYTAGPFIASQNGSPAGCLRSDHNYPHVLAGALHMTLRDASCTGATISKLTRSQGVVGGTNPPQFSQLGSDTAIVTLQIGGNDIGFTDILLRCASFLPFGSPCRDHYIRDGVDQIANKITATGPRLATAILNIRSRAPHARIRVLGYPAILPDGGNGCWPLMPFAWADVPYLRARAKQLNGMIAARAAANGATYVDVYKPSIGHDACAASSTRWVEPFAPTTLAAPVHPNARGMSALARIVLGRL